VRCARCNRPLTEETADRYPIHGASTAGRTVILCKYSCKRSRATPPSYPTR
jgi:hypothetical protein